LPYGLYLKIDQDVWAKGDYSTENKFTGTVYTNKGRTTAKNLTGYTLTVRMFEPYKEADFFNKTADIVVAANGTWSRTVEQNDMPDSGLYLVKLELSKVGVIESTLNRQELIVRKAPTA
jgi:hypothetical protein